MSSQLQQTTEILSTAPRPDLLHSDIESSDDMDKHSIASSIKSKSDLPRREKVVKSAGVVRMEAIARAADSKSGKYTLGLIAAACYAMYWVVSSFALSVLSPAKRAEI
jgi:hypothetical protein